MSDIQNENQLVIQNWVKKNNLKNTLNGVIQFKATFEVVKTSRNNTYKKVCDCEFRIGGYEIPKIVVDFDGDTNLIPSEFWISNCVFKEIDNELEITGEHKNETIGKYQAFLTL